MKTIVVSPSDFSFLWQDCPRCWWLKVVGGLRLPNGPMPAIFNKIDLGMKLGFESRRLDHLGIPGSICQGDTHVVSQPIEFPDYGIAVQVKGKIDSLVKLDIGGYAVVDFKTSMPKPAHRAHYSRAMHGYALALEEPNAPHITLPKQIGALWLIVWTPDGAMAIADQPGTPSALLGEVTSLDIPMDRGEFRSFLGEVAFRASLSGPPAPDDFCPRCTYMRDVTRYMKLLREQRETEAA